MRGHHLRRHAVRDDATRERHLFAWKTELRRRECKTIRRNRTGHRRKEPYPRLDERGITGPNVAARERIEVAEMRELVEAGFPARDRVVAQFRQLLENAPRQQRVSLPQRFPEEVLPARR